MCDQQAVRATTIAMRLSLSISLSFIYWLLVSSDGLIARIPQPPIFTSLFVSFAMFFLSRP